MELSLTEAEGRLSELVTAAQRGERVVITKNGDPAVELVSFPKRKRRRGIDLDKLAADRRRRGIKEASPEEAEAMIAAFHDQALSRKVLGLN